MIKLLVVFAVLAYATAMPTNDSMTPYGFQNGSLFGNGSVLSENLSADELNAIASVLSSIKIQLWDNKKIFDVVMALKSDENLRSELLDSLKPIAGIMIDGLKEILFSDESKGAIMTLFTRFEEDISMVNGTLDFDMTPEENDNFNKEINYLMEELFANKRIYEVIQVLMTNGEIRDGLVMHLKNIFGGEEPKKALFDLMAAFRHELGLDHGHKFQFPDWDQIFGNGSQYNFNLTSDEMQAFEGVLGSIKHQIWDEKRIFEVARALARDEHLRHELFEKLKPIAGQEPKMAIYEAVSAINDRLIATAGNDTTFQNVTQEDIQEFESKFDYIASELYDNKKIFHLIQVVANDESVRHEIMGGLKEIIYGDEPAMAIRNFMTRFEQEVRMVNETDYDMTPEESQKFDMEYDQLMEELFAKKRIYEVIQVLMTNGEIRDGLVMHLKNIFGGEEPKKALFDLMAAFRHELGLGEPTTEPQTTTKPAPPQFDSKNDTVPKFEFELPEEELHDFESQIAIVLDHLFTKNRIFEITRALTRDFRLRDEVVAQFTPVFDSDDLNKAIYDAFKWSADKLIATEGQDTSFDMTPEEKILFDQKIEIIGSQLNTNENMFAVVRAVFLDPVIRGSVITQMSNILLGMTPKQGLFDFLTIFDQGIPDMLTNTYGLTDAENQEFQGYFDELVVEANDNRRLYEVARAIATREDIRSGVVSHLENLLVGPDPKQALHDAMQAFRFEMFKE